MSWSDTTNGPGTGDIAAIVLGVVCGLQFFGTLYMYLQLRRTRRRLALAESGGGTVAPASTPAHWHPRHAHAHAHAHDQPQWHAGFGLRRAGSGGSSTLGSAPGEKRAKVGAEETAVPLDACEWCVREGRY